jgi:hypothetical protein
MKLQHALFIAHEYYTPLPCLTQCTQIMCLVPFLAKLCIHPASPKLPRVMYPPTSPIFSTFEILEEILL